MLAPRDRKKTGDSVGLVGFMRLNISITRSIDRGLLEHPIHVDLSADEYETGLPILRCEI